ncbi:MAG: amidohydrolase family protein [Chloroflexota bacterium]
MIDAQAAAGGATAARQALIDCDVQIEVPNSKALYPYLPPYWVEHMEQTLFKGVNETYYPMKTAMAVRPETRPEGGGLPGTSLELLQQGHLDPSGVEMAIVNCLYAIDTLNNPDAAIAMASAVNDWQINEWLNKDSRLRGSIVIPSQLPAAAAREIERVGSHPGFVQVLVPVRTSQTLGNRNFLPMWEAIARNNLVGAVHFGGRPFTPPTPEGWPSYYLEQHAGMAQVFATQLTSIVCEGVFDQFPSLKVLLLESGWTWLPPHMWRFDKEWKNLRRLVPWVRRAPSEYIRDHIRIAVQPLDAPEDNTRQLLEVYAQLGSDDMLVYGSDFPHQHVSDPEAAFLQHLPEATARKIRSENARALYGL